MTRVSLINDSQDPKTKSLIERLKTGRRGSLLGIYQVLLHNPELAQSWFQHLNAVRWQTSLDGRLREILIIRVGWRLKCSYILRQHIPALSEPEGLDLAACELLQRDVVDAGFTDAELSAIVLADELTLTAQASEDTARRVLSYFSEQAFVEITVLVGTYNMHARFVAGVNLELEEPKPGHA